MASSAGQDSGSTVRRFNTPLWKIFSGTLLILLAISGIMPNTPLVVVKSHAASCASEASDHAADPIRTVNLGATLLSTGAGPFQDNECDCRPDKIDGCVFTAIPKMNQFPPAGDDGAFHVAISGVAGTDCKIATVRPTESWIQILPHINAQDVRYHVCPNLTGGRRCGRIEILTGAPQLVECHIVVQEGRACQYQLSANSSPEIPGAGGSDNFIITDLEPSPVGGCTSPTCPWTLDVQDCKTGMNPIITQISPTRGNTQNGVVNYTVGVNPDTSPRSCLITVSGPGGQIGQYKVNQAAGSGNTGGACSFTVSPSSSGLLPAQLASGRFTVRTDPDTGCRWTAGFASNPSEDCGNISFTSPTSSDRTGDVAYTVGANLTSSLRSCTIIVKNDSNQPVGTHLVTQRGGADTPGLPPPPQPDCTYSVSPKSVPDFPSQGGTGSFTVTTLPSTPCPWTTESDVPWIRVTASGSGAGQGSYLVEPNPKSTSRTGTITIKGILPAAKQSLTIVQLGKCIYTLSSPQSVAVGEGLGSYAFLVTPMPETVCAWVATVTGCDPLHPDSDVSWVTLNLDRSSARGLVVFSVDENSGKDERCATIVIGDATYTVKQAAKGACTFDDTKECKNKPIRSDPKPIQLDETLYGSLSAGKDCPPCRNSGLLSDSYKFSLSERKAVAINVASNDFDPFITLVRLDNGQQQIIDRTNDDGAGFRNSRLPRLPGNAAFIPLEPATYIVEVTSFNASNNANKGIGNYTIQIATEERSNHDQIPVVLGAVIDRKTLIVIGENFGEKAKLFIDKIEDFGKSSKPEKPVIVDSSRARTALIALKSADKVSQGCVVLRVENDPTKVSNLYLYGTCPKPK
jgi:Viral BACON domain/Putative binding domain, N-terminal